MVNTIILIYNMKAINLIAIILCLFLGNSCGNNSGRSTTEKGSQNVNDFYTKQDKVRNSFIDKYFDNAKQYARTFATNKGYSVQKIEYQGFSTCLSENSGSFSFTVRTSDISSTGGLITINITVEVTSGSMSIYHFQAYS